MKNGMKRIVSIVLTLAMILSIAAVPSMADSKEPNIYFSKNGKYVATKISNPTTKEREADGLVPIPEDADEDFINWARQNSYAWSMGELTDAYGDYVYIGSNRNLMYYAVKEMILMNPDAKSFFDGIVDLASTGEIYTCEPGEEMTQLDQAIVVRYNTKTGEIETYLDSGKEADGSKLKDIMGFRTAQPFNGKLYMNATGDNGSYIFCIPSNDSNVKPELVIDKDGSYMRAMTVSTKGDKLYVGGTSNMFDNLAGEPEPMKVAIYQVDKDNNVQLIADDEESVFNLYEKPDYRTTGGDVWDLVEYKGELYLTIMTLKGAMVFKGHEAKFGETANKYGWVWTEFAGESESSEYGPGFSNPVNYAVTPFIYSGDLYFISFSDIMDSVVAGATGMFTYLSSLKAGSGDINIFLDSLKSMETVLDNESSVFRLTSDGKMQMVVGDEEKCPDNIEYLALKKAGFNDADSSTTVYNWRSTVYNGKLYIGTLDVYPLAKYFTRLTNGDLLNMNTAELKDALGYVVDFVKLITASTNGTEPGELSEDNPAEESVALMANAIDETEVAVETAAAYFKAQLEKTEEQPKANSVNLEAEVEETLEKPEDIPTEAPEFTSREFSHMLETISTIYKEMGKQAVVDFLDNMLLNIPGTAETLKKVEGALKFFKWTCHDKDIEDALDKVLNLVVAVERVLSSINPDGIKTYINISDTLASNRNLGCELYSTTDGVHYETVTLDGFSDEYNYGVRTLLATEAGLLVGTANPFYGAQLWQVNEITRKPDPDPTPSRPSHKTTVKKVEKELPFTDVEKTDWFYDDVFYVWDNSIMNGLTNTLFGPNQTTTRAQVVTMLYRLAGEPAFMNDNVFADVESGSWYEKAVVWASGKGIVTGYNATTFGPNDLVTREQLAAMLYRYAEYMGYDTSAAEDTNVLSYDDAFSISGYAMKAIQWACGSGILNGSNGKLFPAGNATRSELAAMFHRFCEKVAK